MKPKETSDETIASQQELLDQAYSVIRSLEDKLDDAEETIIRLMPEEIQELFRGYWHCKSENDTFRWWNDVIDQIIQKAKIISTHSLVSSSLRAYCPLCGDGSLDPFENGFALPEGLSRHIRGEGNTRRCDVMAAVWHQARKYWKTQSSKWAENEERRINARRNSETLFLLSPGGIPELIDERFWSSDSVRKPESLDWAEKRLVDLGFSLHTDENIKSYILERDNFLIYADPRTEGSIEFLVFKKPISENSNELCSFRFQDSWKHDLGGKFERYFAKAVGERR